MKRTLAICYRIS